MTAITDRQDAQHASPRDQRQALIRAELARLDPLEFSCGPLAVIAEASVRWADEGDPMAYRIVDGEGNTRAVLKDGQLTNLTIEELVAELRQKHPTLFKPVESVAPPAPKRKPSGPNPRRAERSEQDGGEASPEPAAAPNGAALRRKSKKPRSAALEAAPPPATTKPQRLAAVLAAQFSEGSWTERQDGERAHSSIEQLRRDIVEPTLAENAGTLVRWTGKGFLAVFDRPQDAVHCALVLGNLFGIPSRKLSPQARLNCRIGIELGEVLFDSEAIYGDAVTIAERLAALASGGAIHISGGMYEQISNRLACKYRALGEVALDNITHPVRIYRVSPLPVLRSRRFKLSCRSDLVAAAAATVMGGLLGLGFVNAPQIMGLIGISEARATQPIQVQAPAAPVKQALPHGAFASATGRVATR